MEKRYGISMRISILLYASVYVCIVFAFDDTFVKDTLELLIITAGIITLFGLLIMTESNMKCCVRNTRRLQYVSTTILPTLLVAKQVLGHLEVLTHKKKETFYFFIHFFVFVFCGLFFFFFFLQFEFCICLSVCLFVCVFH